MASDGEPAKLLLPYLQRADELQKHEPLVAYYCRLYAMEKGLKIPQKERTKTTNSLLISIMNQLEKDKKSLTLGPDDYLHVEGFALNVFAKADKQDRAGRADINTAKTFYAASIFFEILNQFSELQPDIEQKQKYAIWKAAEIRKALKEGRKPEAGPPGEEKDEAPASTTTISHDMGRNQSFGSGQHGSEASSQHVDKDFVKRQSTDTYSSPPPQSQFPSPAQSSYSSPSYQGTDHPSDVHKPPHNYSSAPYTAPDYPTNEVHKPPSNYSSPPYTRTDYPSNDSYNPQSNDKPDVSAYPYSHHQPPYTIEPQHTSQNYYSTETPPAPYNYSNFQSYPSFQDSSVPSVPTNQPSFYSATSSDGTSAVSYSPSASNYSAPTQYHSSADNTHQVTPPAAAPPTSQYKYDSSYQPEVEKIAEAHKSARFAVGALAFDDVSVAVDHLKRALDLLTNPSAETH
uniref:Vta1/callose synthase N-terminal domain-containing protein n=1 Tax=Leersia perrieri TaxID=77586 RepID=A0A0D9WPQ2_9ORYZ